MATIDNTEYGKVVRGTSGEDSIRNDSAYDVTIQALAGNDTVLNNASYVMIDGGTGKDYLSNDKSSGWSFRGGTGGSNVSMFGGDGNDTLDNYGSTNTLDGGAGNDYIAIRGSTSDDIMVYGQEDNDSVYNAGSAYIILGEGNDMSIMTA